MAEIVLRAGKGSPLTNAEVDANFTNLNTAVIDAAATATWAGVTGKPATLAGFGITDAQPLLVSGTSIKTVNGESVLGSGNIQIDGGVTSFNTRTGAVTLGSGDVTTALGYTPYNATNPSGFISGINSSMVTTALGFTPANKAGDTFTGNVLVNSGADSRFLVQSFGVTQGQLQATASLVRLSSNNTLPLNLSTSGVDRLTFESNGQTSFNSNVFLGVGGAASTTARLRVLGTGLSSEVARFENGTQSSLLLINQTDDWSVNSNRAGISFRKNNVEGGAFSVEYNGTRGIVYYDAVGATGAHAFYINSVDRLRLNASGAMSFSGAGYGTAGQFLKTGGTSAAPTWSSLASSDVTTALGYTPLSTGGGNVSYLGINNASAINLRGAGSGTYNTSWIYSDTTVNSWEAPKTTDAVGGARVPFVLTWRGGYGSEGGLRLTGGSSGELGGNAILHAGNVSTYALPLSGGGLTTGASSTLFVGRNSTATNYNAISLNGSSVDSSNMGLTGGGVGDTTLYINSPGAISVRTNGFGHTYSFSGGAFNAPGAITQGGNQVLHAGNVSSYAHTISTNPNTPGPGVLAIGNQGSYSFVQSHNGQPLNFNPAGNTVQIAGNVALHAGNYGSYALPLSGGSVTGALNVLRQRLSFSSSYNDANHSIYNNYTNIDGEGVFDGMKMNVYDGLRIRTGNASGTTPTLVFAAYNGQGVHIPGSFTMGSRTNASTFGGNTGGMSGNSFVAEVRANGAKPTLTFHYENVATTHIEHLSDGSLNVWRPSGEGTSVFKIGNNVALHAGNYNSYSPSLGGSGASGTWGITTTADWLHSDRDFPSGTLITTNIYYGGWAGEPFVLEIRGNSYGNIIPFDIQYQGYIYADTIINHGGYSNGTSIGGLVALNVGGNLCFWFPNQSYWHGYNVRVYVPYGGRQSNRVTSITGQGKPSGTKEVGLSSEIRQSLHSGNYTNYSPSLTGSGASGTWGISVTGTANGLSSSNYISRTGSSGNLNTDFQNTPAGSTRIQGDDANLANSPGNAWWFYQNMRHTNSSNFWGTQVAWGWEDNANRLATRNVTSNSFGSWVYYLNSSNYSSYALPLSGGTLSGALTGTDIYANSWLRNNNINTGLYNQATGCHFYSNGGASWGITGTGGGVELQFRANHQSTVRGYVYADSSSNFGLLHNNGGWAVQVYPGGNGYLHGTWNGANIRANRAAGNLYIDDNYGCGIVGAYASTRYQGVFAMGDSYKLPADGTSTGSLYGMAWSHPNAGGVAGNLTDHGLLIINNGGFRCAISNSIVASANITAYSDERLKTNWRDLPENFVARLAKVKVGIYDRLDEENVTQVGVSAQSFQELLPQAIMTAKDEMGTLSVSYGNAALASAVELAKDNVDLRARVAKLEALVSKLIEG